MRGKAERQLRPPLRRRPPEGTSPCARHPMAAPERGPTGPAHPRPPPQRPPPPFGSRPVSASAPPPSTATSPRPSSSCSPLAPTLAGAVRAASTRAFVIPDGTLLPIDRIAADRPFYSGKHKKHDMNVQVIADWRAASCGLRRPWPVLYTMSRRHVSTASSTLSPRPASTAGQTRATRAQAARSGSPTPVDGTAFPPVSRPSIGPTPRSGLRSNKPWPPSSPGDSSATSAAQRPGSPAPSKPSSASIWPAETEVGKCSMAAGHLRLPAVIHRN